jgi:EAL domain-containing protein (putative c-di-GMP-specific phosphodiesterase class I)
VVTLEITETSLMTDPEQAVDALTRLRSIGVRLSVDDLGTGYSSLAYLLKLPVDELKIDRSLVSTLPDEPAEVVVGAIADLGHRLGRHVVAEGIEDAVTYDVVRRLGCDLAQGYWMGRPMPVEDLRTYLADRRNTRRGGLRQVL